MSASVLIVRHTPATRARGQVAVAGVRKPAQLRTHAVKQTRGRVPLVAHSGHLLRLPATHRYLAAQLWDFCNGLHIFELGNNAGLIFRCHWSLKYVTVKMPRPCVVFFTRWSNLMVTSSRYLMNGSLTRCTFCNEPFRPRNGFVEVWRTSNGDHFCSEFCADDAEEAHFRKRRSATPSVAALIIHSA